MAKTNISAALQKAARQALKAVSAVKQGNQKQSPVKPRLTQNPRQKAVRLNSAKVTVKGKQSGKKNSSLKIDPASLLKEFQAETKVKNKNQIRQGKFPQKTPEKAGRSPKIGKEILQKIKVSSKKGAVKNSATQKQFLPVSGYRISSGFGEDRGDHRHSGIDLAVAEGTAVAAVKSGTVAFAGWSSGGSKPILVPPTKSENRPSFAIVEAAATAWSGMDS